MTTEAATARALAGVLGRTEPDDRRRLQAALGGAPGRVVDAPPLLAGRRGSAHTGRGPQGRQCLLAGAIYNADQLASALGADADIEELLALAYGRWGPAMLERLRGDFTLIAWDEAAGKGLLARDQLGTGSVFFSEGSGRFSFATEAVELLALLPRRPAPDDGGVLHWLTAKASRPDITLYEGVRRLPPGWCAHLDRAGVRLERYWEPPAAITGPRTRAEAVEAVRPLLETAVRRRLDPGAPTGVTISGGLDSSGVAGIARRLDPGRVRAYSDVFPEHPRVDEWRWIERLADCLGLPLTRMEVGAQGLVHEAADAVARWALPPLAHSFWEGPLYERAAEDGVRVLFTGDGGDELFTVRRTAMADRLRRGNVIGAIRLARTMPLTIAYPPPRAILRSVFDSGVLPATPPLVDRLRARHARDDFARPPWLLPRSQKLLDEVGEPAGAWKQLRGPRWWAESVHRLTVRVPAMGLFDDMRRRGLRWGVEFRAPLFDLDLLEAVLRMPPEPFFGPTLGKPVLRGALTGDVPDNVRLRPLKTVFNDVLVTALRGPDRPHLERLLTGPGAELPRYVRPDAVCEMLAAPDADDMPTWYRAQALWRLLGLECWLRSQEDPGSLGALLASAPPKRHRLRPDRTRPRSRTPQGGTGTSFPLDPPVLLL